MMYSYISQTKDKGRIFLNIMKIEDLVKDLDSVTIIEFKNYILEHLSELCPTKNSNSKVISKFRNKETFCENCGCKIQKNGKTKNGVQKYICSGCKKTLSETTNTIICHSKLSFEIWLSKFRGVSTRHFQEYLDWFVYIFTMKKRFMLNKIKTEAYSKILINNNYIRAKDIFNIAMPIDLNIAYAEYINQS